IGRHRSEAWCPSVLADDYRANISELGIQGVHLLPAQRSHNIHRHRHPSVSQLAAFVSSHARLKLTSLWLFAKDSPPPSNLPWSSPFQLLPENLDKTPSTSESTSG